MLLSWLIMKNNFIYKNENIKKAIKLLQENKIKILIVVDKNNRIFGTVTDGDVRRGLLNEYNLKDKVENICEQKPLIFSNKINFKEAIKTMELNKISYAPIINEKKEVIKILDNKNFNNSNSLFLIMAGGFGSRLMPLTKKIPKPLLKYKGFPILENIIKKASVSGFKNIIISTHYLAKQIKNYCKEGSAWGVKIEYIYEKKPLGTAGCLSKLKKINFKNVIICNADIDTNLNFDSLLKFHTTENSDITAVYQNYNIDIPYGVFDIQNKNLVRIKEKPSLNFKINSGIYVFEKKVINKFKNEKIDMTDFIQNNINKLKITCFPAHEDLVDLGSDINNFI